MKKYTYITLRERPELKDAAAEWFHCKWSIPAKAYLDCIDEYLNQKRNTVGIFVLTEIELSEVWESLKMIFIIEKSLSRTFVRSIPNRNIGARVLPGTY